MIKKLDRLIKPDLFITDLHQIDFRQLYDQGFRLVMLDIDNTLARHGALTADDYARSARDRIRDAGLQAWIISNGGERRVHSYAASLGLPCVPMANKPSRRALRLACRQCGLQPGQAVMIGDQLLTDMVSAHRAGCLAVLVRPRFRKEAWNVRLKRYLEKIFYHRYQLR